MEAQRPAALAEARQQADDSLEVADLAAGLACDSGAGRGRWDRRAEPSGATQESPRRSERGGGGGEHIETAVLMRIARQVASGLLYLHQMEYLHRDVKTGNILL